MTPASYWLGVLIVSQGQRHDNDKLATHIFPPLMLTAMETDLFLFTIELCYTSFYRLLPENKHWMLSSFSEKYKLTGMRNIQKMKTHNAPRYK